MISKDFDRLLMTEASENLDLHSPREQNCHGESLWRLDFRLLDVLPVGVYFCASDGELMHWNRKAAELWGREPHRDDEADRFCGSFHLFDRSGNLIPKEQCAMAETLQTGQPKRVPEAILERPDGSKRVVAISIDPIFDDDGRILGAVNVFQDITPQKQSEESLALAQKRFRQLLEKLPAAAYTCNPEGLITDFNQRAVELWGRAPGINDPVDRFCGSFRLFSAKGAAILHDQCWMAQALRNGRDYQGEEIQIERQDGTLRRVLAYATPFVDENGATAGAVNILVDITEWHASQQRIKELLTKEKQQSDLLREADRRKDEFLAMLAHELRNPLTPILTGLEVLKMSCSHDEETLELMVSQVNHLVRLVDDLLDMSRIVHGRVELRREPVQLTDLIRQSVETIRGSMECRAHQLKVSLPEEPLTLNVDAVRVVQVIENLLNNSCKYTEPGGVIELIAERSEHQAVIMVQDNGIGIDEELLPRIFDLFTQSRRSLDRSQGGLGIGLTLVKNLVEMHEGTIAAYSDGPGKGSRFVVHLPLMQSEFKKQVAEQIVESSETRRVLIVDDSLGSAKILSLLVSHLGPHQIEMAHDGLAAIEKAEQFQPDIMLLDIGLPKLDGFGVARRLRESSDFDRTILVALTGYGQDEYKQKSKDAGFNEHLVKPVSMETIKRVLSLPKL